MLWSLRLFCSLNLTVHHDELHFQHSSQRPPARGPVGLPQSSHVSGCRLTNNARSTFLSAPIVHVWRVTVPLAASRAGIALRCTNSVSSRARLSRSPGGYLSVIGITLDLTLCNYWYYITFGCDLNSPLG